MTNFYELKGLILAGARCPESFLFGDNFCVGLLQEGAYTSRCQMPDFEQNVGMEVIL